MTTTTLPARSANHHAEQGHLTFAHVIRSEWIKLRSLRSTVWSYAIVILVTWGLAALMSLTSSFGSGTFSSDEQAGFIVQACTFGVFFGQLIMAVLGVLVISGEYSTGMIRSTLTAVPRRLPALWAKALVLFVTSFVVGLVSTVGAYAISAPALASQGVHGSILDSAIYLPLIGASFYLAVVSVFALGLGAILRSSAGGIAAALGLILLLPIVFMIAPLQWMHDALPYLMMNAGLASFGLNAFGESPLETWQQILVICCWAAAALIAGAVLLKRRDA